eukprot:comp18290_c0_seq1/m.19322 comp18290_c0_seq1/g.19322  ORF comp18290_c0_seq1/g.19322 comp18290_c0_seq1/m.19322 type:complete len:496 (-) comp18290_c0_seq1:417-1904(-)
MSGFIQRAWELFRWHYADTVQRRTPAQEKREETLFFGIRFQRWMMLPAAVIIQIANGSAYTWTVYTVPVEQYIGVKAGTGAVTVFFIMGSAGMASALCGPLVNRLGPATCLFYSSVLMVSGQALAGLAVYLKSMAFVHLAFGCINGVGVGVCYLVPVSPLLRWYPDKRGLVSFISVGGTTLGIGLTLLQDALISRVGVPLTLLYLAIITFVLTNIGTCVVRNPPTGYQVGPNGPEVVKADTTKVVGAAEEEDNERKEKKEGADEREPHPGSTVLVVAAEEEVKTVPQAKEKTVLQCVATKNYALTYFVFLVCNIPYFVISAKISDICQQQFGKPRTYGATLFTIMGICCLVGRLLFSTFSDRLGRKRLLLFSLLAQGFCLGICPLLFRKQLFIPFCVAICVSGFVNIASTLIAAFLVDLFGTNNLSGLFGITMTASPCLLGIVGGGIFTVIFNTQVDKHGVTSPALYDVNLYMLAAACGLCFFTTLFITVPKRQV